MAALIPGYLAERWRTLTGGAKALERLPRAIEECTEMWQLELGDPFPQPALGGGVGFVAPAVLADGTAAVLKINFPDAESEHEADALRLVDGAGAVRLLADDPGRRALLLERLEPGRKLWELADEDEANRIAAGVLRRFWRTAPAAQPFDLLADRARAWAETIPAYHRSLERPFEAELADEAARRADELAASVDEEFLLHQDFHGGNVLESRRGWLAIDPKPVVGDRAFDTASLLRDRRPELLRDPAPARRIARRLDQLSAELALDRERMRTWGIVHAVAWGMGPDGVADDNVACARLLRELGEK